MFWRTGTLEFEESQYMGSRYALTDIRFDPRGLRDCFQKEPRHEAVQAVLASTAPVKDRGDGHVGRSSNEDAAKIRAAWEAREASRLGTAAEAPREPVEPAPTRPRVHPPYRATALAGSAKASGRVTKDELRQWFPTYMDTSDDFRFESVKLAATKRFLPRTVTRQPLRDVIGEFERTLNRGKPY
jgi:hypothetical protein